MTVGEGTYEHWRAKGHSGDHSLVCLYCHQNGHTVPLVISGRVGGRKRRHFRHPSGTARGGHSPETVWHADGKLLIAHWARRQPGIATAELEWCTPNKRRRADVLLTMTDGTRMAVELQSRLLTDGAWTDRHTDYERQNIIDLWLWHPHCPPPWILQERGTPLWFLDVTQQSIGIPIGRPHPRPGDWYRAPDPTVFGLHHPPCINDTINTRWYRLGQMPADHTGLHLPASLAKELAADADRLRSHARQMTRSGTRPASSPDRRTEADRDGASASAGPYGVPGHGGHQASTAAQPPVIQEPSRGARPDEARTRQAQREAERHETNLQALRERQHRLSPIAIRAVTAETGRVPWSLPADFEHAMGVSLLEGNRVLAVVCPVASRITEEIAERLVSATIYVATSDEQHRIARRCQPTQRIVVLAA